jgi:hypothetical protein
MADADPADGNEQASRLGARQRFSIMRACAHGTSFDLSINGQDIAVTIGFAETHSTPYTWTSPGIMTHDNMFDGVTG